MMNINTRRGILEEPNFDGYGLSATQNSCQRRSTSTYSKNAFSYENDENDDSVLLQSPRLSSRQLPRKRKASSAPDDFAMNKRPKAPKAGFMMVEDDEDDDLFGELVDLMSAPLSNSYSHLRTPPLGLLCTPPPPNLLANPILERVREQIHDDTDVESRTAPPLALRRGGSYTYKGQAPPPRWSSAVDEEEGQSEDEVNTTFVDENTEEEESRSPDTTMTEADEDDEVVFTGEKSCPKLLKRAPRWIQ